LFFEPRRQRPQNREQEALDILDLILYHPAVFPIQTALLWHYQGRFEQNHQVPDPDPRYFDMEHRNPVVERVETILAVRIAMTQSQESVGDRIDGIARNPPSTATNAEAGEDFPQDRKANHETGFYLIQFDLHTKAPV
jgi:hypothetical protein